MSVLINMEMPTSCFECKLLDYTDTFKCRFRFESLAREHGINISRPSWCPLVPVPPHGDLIERNALLELYNDVDGIDLAAYKVPVPVVRQNIIDMPTIIPASGGKEDE